MDQGFVAALNGWTAYYAFTGGAAATLLGLLAIAVTIRYDLISADISDIRDYVGFTFLCFLAALLIAGLALAPHRIRWTLAVPLLVLGALGLAMVGLLVREWLRLNRHRKAARPDQPRPDRLTGWVYVAFVALPFPGLILAGLLIWSRTTGGFAALAISQGLLLATTTMGAFEMLGRVKPSEPG